MATTTSSTPAATSTGTLDANMKAVGREYFGTCADRNTLSDASYEAIVIAEYGQVTPENSMKWDATESKISPPPLHTQHNLGRMKYKLTRG